MLDLGRFVSQGLLVDVFCDMRIHALSVLRAAKDKSQDFRHDAIQLDRPHLRVLPFFWSHNILAVHGAVNRMD